MAYEVKNWRKNTGRGKVKGWFTLVIGDFEINDCSLVEGNKGDFIGLPQRQYEKDGETKYASVVFIPNEKRRWAFSDWAVTELDKIIGVEPDPGRGTEDDDLPF